ncbi:sensor domain-containing diguanylate cyclase [Clostridia bacterium]|nr:sensor domain-containing diguanylate cyclase [Clostridia bacterium]
MALKERDLYQKLLNKIDDGIYFVTTDRTISFWNKAAERITGYMSDEVVGSKCYDNILNHIDKEGIGLCQVACPLVKTMEDGKDRQAPVYLRHKKGYRVPVSIKTLPIYDDQEIVGAIEIFTDQEEPFSLLESIEELTILAHYDALTGLANRRKIGDFLQQNQLNQNDLDIPFGAILADIDNFKRVNDCYGHDAGDEVIKMTGKVLSSIGRKSDLIGRWGGEEYAGIFPGVSQDYLKKIVEKMRVMIENSVVYYKGETIEITISIGAAISRKGENPTELMNRADKMLYQCKSDGRNCVAVE